MNHLEDFGNAPNWGDYLRLRNELTVAKMELELLKGRVAELEAQRRIPRPRIKMPPPGPSSINVRGANPLPPPKDVRNQ